MNRIEKQAIRHFWEWLKAKMYIRLNDKYMSIHITLRNKIQRTS